MKNLIKIVVYDSAGEEHIFNEDSATEQYIHHNIRDSQGEPVVGAIEITTRLFEDSKEGKFTSEVGSIFHFPRRVNLIYSGYNE